VVGEIEVIAEVTRKPHQDDSARDKRERAHQENALDEALKDTFPASDPVSVEQQGRFGRWDGSAHLVEAARMPGFGRLLLGARSFPR
jgi:hypothetical protein